MIKYFVNEKKRQVIGMLDNTRWDAINKIDKMFRDTDFCFCAGKKYAMPDQFRVVVQCDERDEFDPEVGKKIAKERLLKNYYASLDKRVSKFYDAARAFNEKVFDAPATMEENT